MKAKTYKRTRLAFVFIILVRILMHFLNISSVHGDSFPVVLGAILSGVRLPCGELGSTGNAGKAGES